MKITIFTSNQPRHMSLIESLADIADEVYAVQECNTVFPGKVDDFFRKSEVMQEYFSRVIAAEEKVFGGVRFSPPNVQSLAIKTGDLSSISFERLAPALSSDVFVVFGASYIKGPLADFLVEKGAFNIHMGVSPFYRGSSCNFWALYDDHPDLVGATIHMLSHGLDSGAMLFHSLPEREATDPFVFSMNAVREAHRALTDGIKSGQIFNLNPVSQDRTKEIRYSRNADFTDEVAREYLERNLGPSELCARLKASPTRKLLTLGHG